MYAVCQRKCFSITEIKSGCIRCIRFFLASYNARSQQKTAQNVILCYNVTRKEEMLMYHLLFNKVYSGKSRYDLTFKVELFSIICWIFFLFYGMIRENSIKKTTVLRQLLSIIYGEGDLID